MGWIHLHENRQRVREALQTGYVDKVVTLRATAFDELAAAMYTFGYWEQLECIKVDLDKDVELALFSHLKMWDSYRQAWKEQGVPEEECPGLWGLLVREERERKDGTWEQIEWGMVSVRPLPSRREAFQQWRQRWHVENRGFRELNQGGWLESQTWGRSDAAVQTSIRLRIR